ncbi:Transcriptional regulator containing an AAA-type ATPase domain and a DNA-binding domain [Propionispira arboris]|uniref:Transcriptional regulator containing an AAA-type ATPase domain and a DNA-binding domain n=1 Tax=Propionispira arboris TaxID=84035 RepID=A0A1H6Z580_9FIRM|nr:sigma 54-interacting transcriptional regulator [Propionispira arboris]SEJ47856.1 Transcriptional regulator containing an AAA-type ATPase domain and a DNA-binding domain [Propionispira arboris]
MVKNNKEEIKKLILNEKPFEPLSDEKIANTLSILRETVTETRKSLRIINSRERKKKNIQDAILKMQEKNPEITISQIIMNFSMQGIDLSRKYTTSILADEKTSELVVETVKELTVEDPKQDFSKLVGFDYSLVKNIQQAKAAILYPPAGLPTLIVGESGTGKSLFAECMYQYALNKKVLKEDAPFVSLNCADYADNPQLLLSILYGYKKGAFTGADQNTEGMVDAAQGGVLFLDEIHRLPAKGQEMLFSILDKGKFRRLGETNVEHEASVYFIGATTENIESSLLLTFRRRIPMIIELPNLRNRSIQEKAQLVYDFFQEEANRTQCKILVKNKILSAFVLKEYQGNVGQLRSEIQVTCANAYVEKMNSDKTEIHIDFNELIYNTLFQNNQGTDNQHSRSIVFQDMLFVPHITAAKVSHTYPIFEDIYKKVELKYYELKKMGIDPGEIEKIMWTFVLNKFDLIRSEGHAENQLLSLDELKYLVGENISQTIKSFFDEITQVHAAIEINKKVLIYLAIHLSEAVKRIKYGQEIINPNLVYIKENFAHEYDLARHLVRTIEQKENVIIPDGEIGFIAMYIKELLQITDKKNKVAIITVCHGKVASEMIAVVNQLMGVDFPIAIDMPFNTNPIEIFEKVINIAQTIKSDSGILFFVDMGSLVNVGDIVTKRTGIKTRTIDRVDMVSVMEAVRKIYIADQNAEETLDDIYYDIVSTRYSYPMLSVNESNKPSLLLCLCLTGHGVAVKIKELLIEYYPKLKILLLGIMDEDFTLQINKIKQQYNIIAAVGTINPHINGVNFIPFESGFSSDKKQFLDCLVRQYQSNTLKSFLKAELIFLDQEYADKKCLLETIGSLLFNRGYIKNEFITSLFAREEMGSTIFKNGVGIPHGLPAFVKETAIVFIRLKKPIVWDSFDHFVTMICLPAVKKDDVATINDLFFSLKNKDAVQQLNQAKDVGEFIGKLCPKQ